MFQQNLKQACFFITVFFLATQSLTAQFPYSQTFKNTTVSGLVVSGAARLTAASGIDPDGAGYLRLTDTLQNQVGYVYAQQSFPSSFGITADFEFFIYKTGASASNQADGMSFFLFDASVNAFRPGGIGGALGYAQYYSTPGMAKGYLGVGIDEFGNFSLASDGNKNGGPAKKRGSIVIRGPGDGRTASDYVYQVGVDAAEPQYAASFLSFAQRFPDSTNPAYRRIKIILTPGSSLGTNKGYTITCILYKGGTTVTPVPIINNFDYPFLAPAKLQFGMAASTGSITDFHEVRNLNITATNTSSLVTPTITDDNLAVCAGQASLLDVTANDVSNNQGGEINKATVDLDPSAAGIQTTYTDAGKGSYTVGANGVISFTAVNGFSGNSTATYKVSDSYGVMSANAATITINVNQVLAPSLTMTDPAGACAPAVVNITSVSLRTNTAPGATYNYFNTLTNANNNTNNIDATASALTTSGTYYIRASLDGCYTVKSVTVVRSAAATVANAGADQSFCTSAGGQSASLLSNNPDVGQGAWSQVSGPAPATITLPNSANTPVTNMAKGIYTFRWTITNGACAASTDDMLVRVGIVSAAGTNQTVANATSTTLQGNSASPATGNWTQVSGPAATITAPSNAQSAVTGLTAGNTYAFRWTIINGTCSSASDVSVTNLVNTIANAGTDKSMSDASQVTMEGNVPDAGNTGLWTIVASPSMSTPVITNSSSPTTTITGLNRAGLYTFRWTITNGSFSNSDDVSINVLSVLPVTFISFNVVENTKAVTLKWQTSVEINNKYFNVERSLDGISFSTIGQVTGAGYSSAPANYIYNDELKDITAATLYYRVQQVDRDGHFTYSKIISIVPGTGALRQAQFWPNPFSDRFTVKAFFPTQGMATINLFNSSGKLVKKMQQHVEKGLNEIQVSQLSANIPGLYLVEIIKGKTTFRQKLTKE